MKTRTLKFRIGKTSVSFLCGQMIRGGRKFKPVAAVFDFFRIVKKYNKPDGNIIEFFESLLKKWTPVLSLRQRTVAGAIRQIPYRLSPIREINLAIKLLLDSARTRSEYKIFDKFINELSDTLKNNSITLREKEARAKLALKSQPNLRFLRKRTKRPRSRVVVKTKTRFGVRTNNFKK